MGASSWSDSLSIGIGYDASVIAKNSISIGNESQVSGENSMALGMDLNITDDNTIRIGNSDITSIGGQVSWTALSDGRFKNKLKEYVPGLAFINRLRPVSCNWDREALRKARGGSGNVHNEAVRETGFIAQEVESIMEELGFEFNGLHRPDSDEDQYALAYAQFVVPLTKAVQELDAKNKRLENALKNQEDRYNNLEDRLAQLEAILIPNSTKDKSQSSEK